MPVETPYPYSPDQIIIPEHPIKLDIKWIFGQDPISSALRTKLNVALPDSLISLIPQLYRRDRSVLDRQKILGIEGRKVVFSTESGITIQGQRYDALEAGGFGFQPFLENSKIGAAFIDPDAHVQLPTTDNFSELRPSLNQTSVVDDRGKIRMLKDDFTFIGGYTLDEASRKVAANLIILSRLLKEKRLPFLVPLPVAIGTYSDLNDSNSFPVCFVSWLVPYQGERTGRANLSQGKEGELVKRIIKNGPRIAEALRFLHDQLGLTHNQAVSSNFFVPEEKDLPTFLADFGTVYPLSHEAKIRARAHELAHIIEKIINFSDQAVGLSNILDILPDIINNFLFHYLKPNYSGILMNPKFGSNGRLLTLQTIEDCLRQAEEKGVFPINIPIYSTSNEINSLARDLRQKIHPRKFRK